MSERNPHQKFYITTAIDYINGKPHIGHSYEKVAADVLARYYRRKLGQENVLFVTGTDEHGAKIAEYAEKSELAIEEFANQTSANFRVAWDNLNVSYNRFIRTTDEDHIKVVEELITKIKDNGFLYEGDYEGLYCIGHEAFLTEKDLVEGICPDHKTKPQLIKEKNWFFKVSAFTETIGQKIVAGEFIVYPEHSKKEILAMLEEGFNDIAVTRPNVKWGIPVPWDTEQTIYVWVDALINYYTAAHTAAQNANKDFWPADAHLIGPDIAKFHCIIWPALLLAADLPMPESVRVHGFLTLNNQKLSKTTGNIVDPNEWVGKYGADSVRYFLMREVPFDAHGDVSEEKLRARYEGDLANGLGNLVSRVTTLVDKFLDGVIPAGTVPDHPVIENNISPLIESYKFHEALAEIWKDISRANKIVDETKLWELGKTDLDEFARVAKEILVIIENAAEQLLPFIPSSAQKILDALRVEKIEKFPPLFPKVE
jgi:methionyl-tRNA synthetase